MENPQQKIAQHPRVIEKVVIETLGKKEACESICWHSKQKKIEDETDICV